MSWRFVGRADQLGQVRRALESAAAGPLVVMGEPGMGRTALIGEALRRADIRSARLFQVRHAGTAPLSSLRATFPGCPPTAASPDEAASALAPRASGARMVVVVDDAHLVDHATILVLRAMNRAGHAALLASCPPHAGSTARPDPSVCLTYEPGARTILLPPLTAAEVGIVVGQVVNGPVGAATAEALRAASGGSPRVLRALLVNGGLTQSMSARQGTWRLVTAQARTHAAWDRDELDALGESDGRLTEAIRAAWRELATDRLDQLCRIALWCGAPEQVAIIWPVLLMLRGSPDEAMAFIGSLAAGALAAQPHLALVKAMVLAIGAGQVRTAATYLLAAAADGHGTPGLLLAFRAWLLAADGQAREATAALRAIEHGNRETALFVHAARAEMARLSGNAADTVFHLRRALATAECCRDACPWMWPYLSACLADALGVAGRAAEAHSVTARARSQVSASGQYVGDILHALVRCRERTLADYPARPAPARMLAVTP